MTSYSSRFLYLPALVIIVTIVLLLFIIAFSTKTNIERERERIERAMLREGRVVVFALAASLKATFPAGPKGEGDFLRLVGMLHDIAQDPEIAGVTLLNEQGEIIASSFPQVTKEGRTSLLPLIAMVREKGAFIQLGHLTPGENTLEFFAALETPFIGRRGTWFRDKILQVSFRAKSFEMAKEADLRHAALMVAILIILGTGTLYFIYLVQNYYAVDRALKRIRTYMENVVESMSDGLISLDEKGAIVTMNRQAAEILGLNPGQGKGLPIGEVIKGFPLSIFPSDGKYRLTTEVPPGSGLPFAISSSPLKDEKGKVLGQVLILRDLREIQELREKAIKSEKLAAVGRMAASIAHEIRNPLSSIRGFAQYFQKRLQGQKREEEYATLMVREVDRLNRVITELLDFAKPRELKREVCRLDNLMDDVLKLLTYDLTKKKVTVIKNYGKNMQPIIGDREQIAQAFLNVLLNALEAVLPQKGEIVVSLSTTDDNVAQVDIADNGCGIPNENLTNIFEPFFTTRAKGTGLGLAIALRIIEEHGGTITAKNQSTGGALFTITLPLHRENTADGK